MFENFVISKGLKRRFNALQRPALYFCRDDSKIEAGLIDMSDFGRPRVCEVKSGQTYRSSFARHLLPVADGLEFDGADLRAVHGGQGPFSDGPVRVGGIGEWPTR